MAAYEDLLKQVESLKRENSNLQRELHDNSSQLLCLEQESHSMRETWGQGQGLSQGAEADFSFNDEILCREHMASYEENSDINESQTQVEPVVTGNPRVHPRSQCSEPPGGQTQKNEGREILELMQQFEQERANLILQIEAEEKNRKWYYDQIEMITGKIRSLPVGSGHAKQTKKHLEFEVSRLRETMHESFGTNEQIGQRRDARILRIRQIEMELSTLQKHKEQLVHEQLSGHQEGAGLNRHPSSSDSAHSGSGDEFEPEQVTMATQTEDANTPEQSEKGNCWSNIPAIYHGTWPIGQDDGSPGSAVQGHHDLASVMSFNSTNTSSSNGSRAGGQGQGHMLPRQQHQPVPVQQQIHPHQLGTKVPKVEMVYGLLSMLGTHDKDDMSRTLLAMSSSQDSCIAMRQSGCLPLLIQLLHGSDKDSALLGNTRGSKAARARASAALHNIVHSHPDDKRGRREARVLRLLEQIRAHCDQLREASSDEEEEGKETGSQSAVMDHHPGPAIASLMKLSFDEEHRHAICTLGGLHAIAELLQVDNDVHEDTEEQYNVTMRRYACMALTNLTFGDGTNKALLCSMKPSMEALVAQLFSLNEDLCQVAASVVRNLSWKADLASKKTLREVRAVTSLMQAAMRVGKETTLKSILSALWNLSAHCSENKADICAVAGALELLINTLTYKSPSKTTAIIENGGGILRNVSSHIAVREDYRKILRLHGCLQILLKHLRSPSLTIVSNACGTLWNLSARCAEDQQALWEMGAVNMLRNLVHSKHKMISMGSSAALKNLLAARPNMKNVDLNKQNSGNRPTLHVRKQRALESEIDQNLAETCENVESPRDSPVESRKSESSHFMYPVYTLNDGDARRPVIRGQYLPRSRSGDNSLTLDSQGKPTQRVSRSGSQDSVGSTHSDISHDRSRSNSGNKGPRVGSMGGSLDRNKDTPSTPQKKFNSDGRSERNPLGAPNSRILQVMQEVAMHAGIEGQNQPDGDSAVFKAPLPVTSYARSQLQQQQPAHVAHPNYHGNMLGQQPASIYQRYMMASARAAGNQEQHNESGSTEDEKPLDYSLKYRENTQNDSKAMTSSEVGNFTAKNPAPPGGHSQYTNTAPPGGHSQYTNTAPPGGHSQYTNTAKPAFLKQQLLNQRYQYSSAYAETDLDAPDQITDFSARYGAEYGSEQYPEQQYQGRYGGTDPDCADCKLEELRRYNDRLEQTMGDDQVKTFCTEDTPYLSTATSLTDLSTAVKILEEAEKNCPEDSEQDYNGDEIQNFSSKYGENGQKESPGKGQCQGHRSDADKSSRSGSQTTDPQTGTTVITNYNLSKVEQAKAECSSLHEEECPERSFHDNRNDDGPPDQMKAYCEEGTPLCFSRVSSLSSLHSSEAADRVDKRPHGPLQSIIETEDNASTMKMTTAVMNSMPYRQKMADNIANQKEPGESGEKEHKTVTFDDKEQVQETPMMFSRCTSLGSLSSFDTQSVHSSVFSEYSRRASEVVSPSELPDSPSETMPPSPRRRKSPERFEHKKVAARQQLFPQNTETGSVKSEAPVVYADEGTPPLFDTMSQISGLNSDTFDMNDKTLVETSDKKDLSSGSHGNREADSKYSSAENVSNNESCVGVDSIKLHMETCKDSDRQPGAEGSSAKGQIHVSAKVQGDVNAKGQGQSHEEEDKGSASVSDVSEGEDDLLANVISSALPNHSKRIRKSSSDNAIRRKVSGSSKTGGSRGKGQGKCQMDSPSKASGIPLSCKSGSKPAKTNSGWVKNSSTVAGEKSKSHIPLLLRHRDVSRLEEQRGTLDISTDSARSYGDEDTPFNISNTHSVITRSSSKQKKSSGETESAIIKKVESLSQFDGDERCRTYATEDTPFSGSVPASPRNDRKFKGAPLPPDMNQDSVTSFATEDTPFSGSAPGSPKFDRVRHFQASLELEADSVKCFKTEDTPCSGSTMGSPKLERSKKVEESRKSGKLTAGPSLNFAEKEEVSPKVQKPQEAIPANFDLNQDVVVSYATEDTPLNQSNLPSPKPVDHQPVFHRQLMQTMDYDGSEDIVKTFATEGTPLTFSRTGSSSDLSSINTNFQENVKIVSDVGVPAQRETRVPAPGETRVPAQGDTGVPAQGDTAAEDAQSDNSSLLEDSEELLSEIIQSAMPLSKPGKPHKTVDRKPEGVEDRNKNTADNKIKKPKAPTQFQPQRTSSLAQESHDQLTTYAVEGTPGNMSSATSLSNLTIDSIPAHGNGMTKQSKRPSFQSSSTGWVNASLGQTPNADIGDYSTTVSNDSVFLHSEFEGSNSLRVYKTEDTPQSFSCNESLSSLGIVEDDSSNPLSMQIKAIAQTITKPSSDSQHGSEGLNSYERIGFCQNGETVYSKPDTLTRPDTSEDVTKDIGRSDSRSDRSSLSGTSGKEMERHVIGQSSEEQSVADEGPASDKVGERNSSLGFINDLSDDYHLPGGNPVSEIRPERNVKDQKTSKDQKSLYKMEHTPLCFSRNSSLSSLSIHSDDDDDPEDIALLEDCITSALPPRTRPTREERYRNSHRNDQLKMMKRNENTSVTQQTRSYSSADELDTDRSHDSRYTSWRQQPHKSCDEIFRKPAFDAKGRPCRRSRSHDSDKLQLKQHKDVSNKELAESYKNIHAGSFDSLCIRGNAIATENGNTVATENEEVEKQRQQIISESQNLTRSIENQMRELSKSVEKSDEHESEKNDSPSDDQNFFMMCSGITEISVESISKQSFPSSMAPDTDDDILDSSLVGSYQLDADDTMRLSHDRTITEKISQHSCDTTLTDNGPYQKPRMDASITSEDERALAENANIVMAEMVMSRMGISGSTVEDDRFIEYETLSLVSNDYISDTASEASVTWSASSDRTSDQSDKINTEQGSPVFLRRPRILKPGDTSKIRREAELKMEAESQTKAVRGKRKQLYSSKSVCSAPTSSAVKTENFGKNRSQSVAGAAKTSPRSSVATLNGTMATTGAKKSHLLRTLPQASSTPVKYTANNKQRNSKPSLPNRSSSLDPKSPNTKTNCPSKACSTAAAGSNKSTKLNTRGKIDGAETAEKPRALSKQGTFVKEMSIKNAPVISSEERKSSPVNFRQKKISDSSQQSNRNSSGSSRSNTSDSVANDSFEIPPDCYNKSNNCSGKNSPDGVSVKKESKLRRSLGTTQLTNSKKNLMSSPGTKITSPSRSSLNKTNSSGNLVKTSLKSASGSSLAKSNSGSGLTKTGSNSSLKKLDMKHSDSNTSLRNSRPSTPVNSGNNRKVSVSNPGNPTAKNNNENKKQNGKKTAGTGKLSGLMKKDNVDSKQKSVSKLPVAKSKARVKEGLNESVSKRESSPRPAVNRNTVILSESAFDGMCRSSTYDKLNATNELSQVPCHDSVNLEQYNSKSKHDLDKTCRDLIKGEIGVEYNLDDAWASHVEKSIEVMSRSIEENRGKPHSIYEVEHELSKLDLSDTPTKRLSKSGSMSEIELEYGTRINSGTWTKKRSCNDSSLLPNADETSHTLPLKKRSESLNFTRLSSECLRSQYELGYDDTEVWIRRDDRMRCSESGISGKLKKKSLKGSSGFLPLKNVVSKVFGSKKSDKQSRSLIVTEREQKGAKKEKDLKMNKSEIKVSKAELKAEAKHIKAEQKALLKAEAKQLKAEQKAMKKENKLNKSSRSSSVTSNRDRLCHTLDSSLSSLKKSAEDLIDIDKSDDEVFDYQFETSSLGRKRSKNARPVCYQGTRSNRSLSVDQSDLVNESESSGGVVNQSLADRTEQNGENWSQTTAANKSLKQSPTAQHATKTEMLLARRQALMNSSQEKSDLDEESKRKCIVTTV